MCAGSPNKSQQRAERHDQQTRCSFGRMARLTIVESPCLVGGGSTPLRVVVCGCLRLPPALAYHTTVVATPPPRRPPAWQAAAIFSFRSGVLHAHEARRRRREAVRNSRYYDRVTIVAWRRLLTFLCGYDDREQQGRSRWGASRVGRCRCRWATFTVVLPAAGTHCGKWVVLA